MRADLFGSTLFDMFLGCFLAMYGLVVHILAKYAGGLVEISTAVCIKLL